MGFFVQCPICESSDFRETDLYRLDKGEDAVRCNCRICGTYKVDGSLHIDDFKVRVSKWSKVKRAALTHKIKLLSRENITFRLSFENLDSIKTNTKLPSPGMQFSNIIQYLGEQIISNGGYIERLNPDFYAVVGAPNEDEGIHKVKELGTKNLLTYSDKPIELGDKITNINLTFEGWERYETEKRGKVNSKLGFLAMEFGDQKLDKLINDFVKPSISNELGYELVDMRDVPRAGIIDNIMRAQILDSEFVIVDLTHGAVSQLIEVNPL